MNIETVHVIEISRIEPLWQELIWVLAEKTTTFQTEFRNKEFLKRIAPYLEKITEGYYLINVVVDPDSGKDIGYCFSSITKNKIGEIDSLYVNPNYQGLQIGAMLMERAITFFDEHHTVKDIVQVSEGNEDVMSFYQKYNFTTRYYQMIRQK